MGVRGGSLFALGVLALCSCGSTQEPPQEMAFASAKAFNPLGACETTNFGKFVRAADCPGAHLIFVSRQEPSEAVRERARVNLSAYGFEAEPRELLVNGRSQPTLQTQMGPLDKPDVGVLLTAFDIPGTTESIEVQCLAWKALADPKRCAALLDGFIERGLLRGEWPAPLDDADPQRPVLLDVAGREIKLPSSCDELAPYDLDCKDGHVRLYYASEPAQLPRLRDVELARTKDASIVREWTYECLFEGVASECTLRRYRLPFHDELWSFTATATVRGHPLMLACDVKKTRAPTMPGPICGQLLTLDDAAFAEPPSEE